METEIEVKDEKNNNNKIKFKKKSPYPTTVPSLSLKRGPGLFSGGTPGRCGKIMLYLVNLIECL